MIKDTHIRRLPIKIIRCRCYKFQADVSSSRYRIKKEKKKITTIILKATRTKLKRKPPLVLRDIENIPYVPQFLNLHFEFDAHTFTYKKKKLPHIWKNEVHGATIYIIHVCILQFVVNKWFGGGRIRKKKENERKWQTTAVILIYHRAGPVSAHLFPM